LKSSTSAHATCARAEIPHELSADPSLPHWKNSAVLELREATASGEPIQRTAVRLVWTATEWRVLFCCADTMPWATITARDGELFKEETVEIFFDPVGDLESYYEIEVNPLGTEMDIVFRRSRSGYKGDWAWDCAGLRTLAKIVPGGWNVELAIPFASVAETPSAGTKWRANFCRIDRPSRDGSVPRELTAWSPPMRETFHTQERFGVVEFVA
jgi:hypothetical protein